MLKIKGESDRKSGQGHRVFIRKFAFAFLVVAAFVYTGYASCAHAFAIPTGNRDWTARFDSTLRYTLQYRVQNQDDAILNSPNGDDGDRNFDKGIVGNRVDFLEEFDLVYRPMNAGLRVSGAFWYDQAYNSGFDNDSVPTSNYFKDGVQSVNSLYDYADGRYAGPDGELLDLFVFGTFDAGTVPICVKLGRHIYSWGQVLLSPTHGINYGQMPLDIAKAQAIPGVEVKELMRPQNSISSVIQLTPDLQIAGQYFFEWERNILPAEGTYFGFTDVSFDGEGALITGLGPTGVYTHGRDIEADDTKDFGVSLQYTVMSDTTFGLYYRKFSDRFPSLIVNIDPTDFSGKYHVAYQSDVDLYGLSVATSLFSWSLGAEISYRHNMPLNSTQQYIFSDASLPEEGETLGAGGNVLFGVVNLMGLLKNSPFWDSGSWIVEFTYSRWLDLTSDPKSNLTGASLFKGADDYTGFDKVSKDAAVLAVNFSPQWLQVLPGLDMSLPLSVNYGLWGVGSTFLSSGKGDGNASAGVEFEFEQKYKLNFTYSHFFGKLGDNGTGSAVSRGNYGLYKDRNFISATFKVSF